MATLLLEGNRIGKKPILPLPVLKDVLPELLHRLKSNYLPLCELQFVRGGIVPVGLDLPNGLDSDEVLL